MAEPRQPAADLRAIAQRLREHAVFASRSGGEGYVGQGLQAAELFSVLFFDELAWAPEPTPEAPDLFLLSVGHYALSLYTALVELGVLEREELATYGQDGARLTFGSEPGRVPGVTFAGGSLGQGLGVATGLALGRRLQGAPGRVVDYLSDGEVQEGATWEAAMLAGQLELERLCCVVDVNSFQSDGTLYPDLQPLAAKFEAFGWFAVEVDGHDIDSIRSGFAAISAARPPKPAALIAATEIGHGSALVHARPNAHYVRLDDARWATVEEEVVHHGTTR